MNTVEKKIRRLNEKWNPAIVALAAKRRRFLSCGLAEDLQEVWPYVRPVMRPMHAGEEISREHPINAVAVEYLLCAVSCWEIEIRRIE